MGSALIIASALLITIRERHKERVRLTLGEEPETREESPAGGLPAPEPLRRQKAER